MHITTKKDRATVKPQACEPAGALSSPAARKAGPTTIWVSVAGFLLAGIAGSIASAEEPARPHADPLAEILAAPPFAILQLSRNMIALPFPSIGGVAQSVSLDFVVVGNARATLTAEPAESFTVNGKVLGRAENGAEAIGFDVILEFQEGKKKRKDEHKRRGSVAAPITSSTADLIASGLESKGTISLVTDPKWALNGGMPLPGNYVGEIILTLTADY